jgi:hypothetical protein
MRYTPKVHVRGNRYAYETPAHKTHAYEIHAHDVVVHGIYAREVHAYCEGLPGVHSTIWCLCYKTNKLKKRKEEGDSAGQKRGQLVALAVVASP